MELLKQLKFSKEHTWVRIEGDFAFIGISDFAQSELGEMVAIDIPTLNENVEKDEVFGVAEAVKTSSDLFMPISGRIVAVNSEVEKKPALLNSSPYEQGWIIKVIPTDLEELETLFDYETYQNTYTN